jgi:hypothetical protein
MDSVEASLKSQGLKRQHILYFFFDGKYDTQKTALSLLRALLRQIIQLSPDSIRHLMPEYLSHGDGVVDSLGTLWKVFLDVIADKTLMDGVYLIVDALDECEQSSRETLIQYFEQNFHTGSSVDPDSTTFLKVLVTGRPYKRIERFLHPAFCIRLKTENEEGNINKDITSFI